MQPLTYHFSAALWLYSGKGAWHFITLPKEAGDEIRFFNGTAKGFMPIPVVATIGSTQWKTSIFPDSKSGSYLLAVKADVRKRERLVAGNECEVQIIVRSEL
jgi:hypothetical protein